MKKKTRPPTSQKPQPASVITHGQVGLIWACERGQGGCGYVGVVNGLEPVRHWQGGGSVRVECKCGAAVTIAKPERPRIVTPTQHAREVASMRGR